MSVSCYYLAGIQVSGVLHSERIITIVPLFNDRVQEVCKYLKETQNVKIQNYKTMEKDSHLVHLINVRHGKHIQY